MYGPALGCTAIPSSAFLPWSFRVLRCSGAMQGGPERLIAACGGESIKLFDAASSIDGRPDPCVSHFVPSPGVQVNTVRWNHTNHVLASSGEDRKISLWLKGGKLLGSVPQPDVESGDTVEESILAINFSTKSSRYLCSGGTGKVVRIWDMQRKRCIKWLRGHTDTISGVMYNCKDEHLASISTRGDLIVYSLASGSRVTEVKDPHNQVLRVLEYSRSSRHILLTAGDDGSVHLWDTTGRSPKASWVKQHLAPTTGVGFAPCSEKMIVSVGLDKRLYTYDTTSKKPTNCIACDSPFSSVMFQDEGWILAAGTNNGRVLFYDVRNKVQPLGVLRAFNPSEAVASLSWQHSNPVAISTANWSPDVALLGSVGSDSTMLPDPLPTSSLRSRPPTSKSFGRLPGNLPVTSTFEESTPQSRWSGNGSFILHSSRNVSSGVDDMEVFSPLVDVQPILPQLSGHIDGAKKSSNPLESHQYAAFDDRSRLSRQNDQWSASVILTPQDSSLRLEKSPSVTPPEAWGGGDLEKGPSRTHAPVQSRFATTSASGRSELFSNHEAGQSPAYTKPEFSPPARSPADAGLRFSPLSSNGPSSPGALIKGPSFGTALEKSPKEHDQVDNSSKPGSYSPLANGSSPPRSSGQTGSSSFALQLVQRALEESLGSMQRAMHEDVQNLHVELLRQFHIQHTDMSVMIEKLAAQQAEMMEEMQALRKENQQLRHLL